MKIQHRNEIYVIFCLVLVFVLCACNQKQENICIVDNCSNQIFDNNMCLKHCKEDSKSNTISMVDIDEYEPADANDLQVNSHVVIDGVCEMELIKHAIASRIEPPNVQENSYYYYFEAKAGEKLYDIVIDIRNIRNNAVHQDDVIDYAYIMVGKSKYQCAYVVEKKSGQDFDKYTSTNTIEPKEKLRYHLICEVPDYDTSSSIILYLGANKDKFAYVIK